MSLTPIITDDDDGNELSYEEACRRTAQLYTEEADTLDPGEQRDYALERASAFTAEAELAASQEEGRDDAVPVVTGISSMMVRPLGDDSAEWVPIEGVTSVAVGYDGSRDDDAAIVIAGKTATTSRALTEEESNELATMTDGKPERIPNRLVYASDVVAGMNILYDRPCARGMISILAGPHSHGQGVATVVETRQGEGAMSHLISAIVLDEDGEQQPRLWHTVELVRIRVEGGSL